MALNAAQRPSPAPPSLVRRDSWLLSPMAFVVLFTAFSIWVTFRAFQGDYFSTIEQDVRDRLFSGAGLLVPNYLSPLYSPTLPIHLAIGRYVLSPALYILVFPLSFRLSCYYYRKAIYRGYLADPLACAVPEPRPLEKARFRRYTGERAFPLIAMNFHRYAFYAAAVFVVILWKDTFDSFWFLAPDKSWHVQVHVGSIVFLANILLLSAYTFSCHSWRHLVGGSTDCYSCTALSRTRHGVWNQISFLNERHGLWAMASLVSVALTDVYVFLVTTGKLSGPWF
ncbi:MAG TPA: hypothetical protein VKT77_07680 [Chthonomonadaceae bacterium]|nr:hypothetical protein [Chthonomonadaceae bacterium]